MNKSMLSGRNSINTKMWKSLPVALLLCFSFMEPSLAQEKMMLRSLSVTGQGEESIPATLAEVSLGVEIQGKTAASVQAEAANKSNAVVELLKSRNVSKLETTGVNLNPIYSYKNDVQQINGYSATNTVSFQIASDRVGTLLDDAVKAGATRINNVNLVAPKQAIAQARQQALIEATQDAQQQAQAVLKALGFQPKEVVNIQINGASAPPPIMYRQDAARNVAQEAAPTPVVSGEQEVSASVTLQISY